MRNPRVMAGIVIALAFIGYLLWATIASQAAECHVCMSFRGGRNCATASAATPTEAARSARTTACGTLAQGMDASIACGNSPPLTQECRKR
jgi:hypothetical protein